MRKTNYSLKSFDKKAENLNGKEVKKMRKTLIIGLVSLLAIVLAYGFADATVTGRCDNCHTMHNSQNGVAMNFDNSPTPNALLLRGGCIGCHAQNTANNIVSSVIPQVYHTNATDLAGGNFRYGTTTQANIHNVDGLPGGIGQDTALTNNPPGFLAGYDPATANFNTANRLVCAGQNGCHGNRDESNQDTAIKGSHHYNDAILKFATINDAAQGGGAGGADIVTSGKSYRFLYNVHGGEDIDWQATIGANDHNEYKGALFAARGQTETWADVTTISDLCAECHGQFHAGGLTADSGIGTASPWLRHPTDALLPNTGEYTNYTAYDTQVPVGRSALITAALSTVAPGTTDVVACVSCHAAHGTPYSDILRWNYTVSMPAGTGCLKCHYGKSAY